MGSVFLNMKYKIIYIILLMLGNATLFCEINKMDDFVVKDDKPNTKIECNLLLSLNHSAESAGTELFSINKIKISNKEGSVSRCYIIDGDQNQSEITNTDNIYSFDERHRHSILNGKPFEYIAIRSSGKPENSKRDKYEGLRDLLQ